MKTQLLVVAALISGASSAIAQDKQMQVTSEGLTC